MKTWGEALEEMADSSPKAELKRLLSEKPELAKVVSEGILAGFAPSERLAILYMTNPTTPETIRAIPEREWLRVRLIGKRFIRKLERRGWLGGKT